MLEREGLSTNCEKSPGRVEELMGFQIPSVRLPDATGAMKSLKLDKLRVLAYQGPLKAVERLPPLKTFQAKVLASAVMVAEPALGV